MSGCCPQCGRQFGTPLQLRAHRAECSPSVASGVIPGRLACAAWHLDDVERAADRMGDACRVAWKDDLRRGTKTMHWLGADQPARAGLENFAKAVFDFHTRGVAFDPRSSGAVWWCQVRELPGEHGDAGAGIHWHWDLDHQGRAQGIPKPLWTPTVATVTYLTTGGAPTAMLHDDQLSLSPVRRGVHLAFRGDLLHGAPQELNTSPAPYTRVTLLVNVWLNHHPAGLLPMPEALADQLRGHPDGQCEFSASRCRPLPVRRIDETRFHPPLMRDLTVGGSLQLKISFPNPWNLWREGELSLLRLKLPEGDGVTASDGPAKSSLKPLDPGSGATLK